MAIAPSALDYETRVAVARSHAGETVFEYAPEEPESPEDTEPPASYPAGLSAREVEVLKPVAQGIANAQIAKELYVSPRAVNFRLGAGERVCGRGLLATRTLQRRSFAVAPTSCKDFIRNSSPDALMLRSEDGREERHGRPMRSGLQKRLLAAGVAVTVAVTGVISLAYSGSEKVAKATDK